MNIENGRQSLEPTHNVECKKRPPHVNQGSPSKLGIPGKEKLEITFTSTAPRVLQGKLLFMNFGTELMEDKKLP